MFLDIPFYRTGVCTPNSIVVEMTMLRQWRRRQVGHSERRGNFANELTIMGCSPTHRVLNATYVAG
jgi:hypothetical protein